VAKCVRTAASIARAANFATVKRLIVVWPR
jgi:hypothetical protein